jgi:hypothetical protein
MQNLYNISTTRVCEGMQIRLGARKHTPPWQYTMIVIMA